MSEETANIKRIAIITARSGSKGIRDKNIRPLMGKPLMVYSIEAALDSGAFDSVFVSTDSAEYARIAEAAGADAHFLRSETNSSDKASSWDTVREVIGRFGEEGRTFDEIMLLQPTSPLRTAEDIRNAIEVMREKNALSVQSVTETDHSPLWCGTLPPDGCMDGFSDGSGDLPRQALPTYYRLNGAIFLLKRKILDRPDSRMFRDGCYAYIMPRERSVDIDTELDLKLAGLLLKERIQN